MSRKFWLRWLLLPAGLIVALLSHAGEQADVMGSGPAPPSPHVLPDSMRQSWNQSLQQMQQYRITASRHFQALQQSLRAQREQFVTRIAAYRSWVDEQIKKGAMLADETRTRLLEEARLEPAARVRQMQEGRDRMIQRYRQLVADLSTKDKPIEGVQ